ncbi:MAG TPA: hypothetical protein VGC41_13865 [Kofleriaceae bacterium]
MSRSLVVALLAVSATAFAGGKGGKPAPPKPPPAAPTPPPPEPEKPFPSGVDKRRIIGILDLKVDGAPPEVAAQFQRDLEAQVDTQHYFLASRTRMHDRMANSTKWSEGCIVGACLKEVKVQSNADVVLLAALTGSGTSYGWVITLVGTESGRVIGQENERCDVCTVSESLNAATLATIKLLNSIPDDLAADARPLAPAPPPPVEHHRSHALPVGLAIAGAVIAAAGIGYYAAQDHSKPGLAVAGVGGGLLVGGLVTLAF